MEELLTEIVRATGPHALWLLFGVAIVEYVFPPFPGDTVTLFGSYYAVTGVLPMPLVFLSVLTGNIFGAAIDYLVGSRLREMAKGGREGTPLLFRWVSEARVAEIERALERRGDLLILANRFLPGIRGFLFIAAGMGRMPFRRVMFLGAVSASCWNALLLLVGYLVGANLSRLESIFRGYSKAAWIAVAAVVLVLVARRVLRKAPPSRETD